MRTHIEINVQTGERTERPYTAKEEAAADAMMNESPSPPARDLAAELDALKQTVAALQPAGLKG